MRPLWKTVWNFLRKVKMELPFDPAMLLLGLYLRTLKHQSILNKQTAFHTAQLFNESGDYLSQGLTWPNSSHFQVLRRTSISLVLASTDPAHVYCLCLSPTLSLFPPVASSIQVPLGARLPSLLWEGRSWLSNSPPCILQQMPV